MVLVNEVKNMGYQGNNGFATQFSGSARILIPSGVLRGGGWGDGQGPEPVPSSTTIFPMSSQQCGLHLDQEKQTRK